MAKKSKRGEAGSGIKTVEKQTASNVPPRLWERYKSAVVGQMMKEFGYENVMEVPKVTKITINMGLGEAVGNPNIINNALVELTNISGQKAVVTRAKKSISNFKLRTGMPIGCMVTLRRNRMWEFLDRLVAVAMPRMRDFKGISGKAFDGRGNYSLGIREQIIFPEVDYDKVDQVRGFNVTISTTAKTDKEGKAVLKHLGLPFRN